PPRPEPPAVRQAARQRARDPALRLRQDLQRQGVQPVLADAPPRALGHAERRADQGSRRAAARSRLAGEPVVLQRREFLRLLALAAAAGAGLRRGTSQAQAAAELY